MSENLAEWAGTLLERSGVAAYWRWWAGELLSMAPARLRELVRPARAQLALAQSGGEWVLHHWVEGRWMELARWDRGEPGNVELPVAATKAFAIHGQEALLILETQESLVRQVSVPMALAENLRDAIGFELDRYTPYKPDQVYFGVQVLARDQDRRQLAIAIGVAPRERAERAIEQASGYGVSVAALLPQMPQGSDQGLDLLPPERRGGKRLDRRWAYFVPVSAVCVLALVAVILPIWHKRANVRALEPLVNEARARAEAAEAVHRELLSRQAEYNFLLARKHSQAMVVEVLDEASRILPDDTWAHLVELKSDPKNRGKNRELQIRGETGISGKLISVFEESRLFTQATYKSPVTKGQPGAGDVFHVAAEVKQRPVPGAEVTPVANEAPLAAGPLASPGTSTVGEVKPTPPAAPISNAPVHASESDTPAESRGNLRTPGKSLPLASVGETGPKVPLKATPEGPPLPRPAP